MEALKTYLKEVRLIPLLTAKQEVELNKRIRKGDEIARKDMIRANLRLVINIAKRYMRMGTPFLDLIEEGNLGLMKAVEKFDHRKGFRLHLCLLDHRITLLQHLHQQVLMLELDRCDQARLLQITGNR